MPGALNLPTHPTVWAAYTYLFSNCRCHHCGFHCCLRLLVTRPPRHATRQPRVASTQFGATLWYLYYSLMYSEHIFYFCVINDCLTCDVECWFVCERVENWSQRTIPLISSVFVQVSYSMQLQVWAGRRTQAA
jgi:hypothetical protein